MQKCYSIAENVNVDKESAYCEACGKVTRELYMGVKTINRSWKSMILREKKKDQKDLSSPQ